jgi:formylglycine-generating enzyme required for sulfatase activity
MAQWAISVILTFLLVLEGAEQHPPGSTNSKDGLNYAWVPAGTFVMGCDNCRSAFERPEHKVTLTRGFWMGTTEVTTAAFKRYVRETNQQMPPETVQGQTINPGWKDDQLPMVNLTWAEAAQYCKWSGGSLPTEAQWEYAARGGSQHDPYGPINEIAWTASNSGDQNFDSETLFRTDPEAFRKKLKDNRNRPHPVGQKRPNVFGLYDMLGNVLEFTADWADPNYYSHSPEKDPTGPAEGRSRISRGGYFAYVESANHASKRLAGDPAERSPISGMRCVLSELR